MILYTVSDYQLFTSPHSTFPPSTPPPPTTSQSGSMSLSATVRERLRTKLLKAKVRKGGREGGREGGRKEGRKEGRGGGREGGREGRRRKIKKSQKLLTHKDDNVYMYITVLVLFPGPSILLIWRLGTGLTQVLDAHVTQCSFCSQTEPSPSLPFSHYL